MTSPFRNHSISPIIQIKIRLLQMDVVKSDRVFVRYALINKDDPEKPHKAAVYHTLEDFYRNMETHSKVHYINYHHGRLFEIEDFKVVEYRNNNRFKNLRGL